MALLLIDNLNVRKGSTPACRNDYSRPTALGKNCRSNQINSVTVRNVASEPLQISNITASQTTRPALRIIIASDVARPRVSLASLAISHPGSGNNRG